MTCLLGHQGSATWQFRPRIAPGNIRNFSRTLNFPLYLGFFGWKVGENLKFDIDIYIFFFVPQIAENRWYLSMLFGVYAGIIWIFEICILDSSIVAQEKSQELQKSCLLCCQAQIHRIVPQCFNATAVATNAKLSGSKLGGTGKIPWTRMKTGFYSCENKSEQGSGVQTHPSSFCCSLPTTCI